MSNYYRSTIQVNKRNAAKQRKAELERVFAFLILGMMAGAVIAAGLLV